MIKNIVFDMGNVLVRFDPELFMDRYSLTGEDRRLIRNEVFRSVEWTMLDRGVIDEEIAEQRILPRLPERLHDAARGLIETWDDPIVPVEGMLELLQALKAKGYRLYLLSNAATRQPIYWARAEASKLMDGALISAEVKLLKPDPQIYRTFLRKFALRPEECVFIDDTPINVEGALYENMAGIVFNMDVAALAQSLHALGVEWYGFDWRNAYDDLDRFDAFDLCRILRLCGGIPVGTGKTACKVFFGRFHRTKKRGKLHLSGDPVRDPWNRHQPVTAHFS